MMCRFGFEDKSPTVLHSNNLGAIHLTSKSIFHGRTKHIEIQYHWIREIVTSGQLVIKHCPTEMMIADMLTKSLGKPQCVKLSSLLGMKPALTSSLEGVCHEILVTNESGVVRRNVHSLVYP